MHAGSRDRYVRPPRAVYTASCFHEIVLPAVKTVLIDHNYAPVDTNLILETVIGHSERSIALPGPEYDPAAWKECDNQGAMLDALLNKHGKLLDGLMSAIFSKKETVARNSHAVEVSRTVHFAEFVFDVAYRKVVYIFKAATDNPEDYMKVTIRGVGQDPDLFTFQPTVAWIKYRYPPYVD